MSRPQRNYYEILGVPQTASGQEIGSAYRSLAVKYHPDTARDEGSSGRRFKDISEAYDVLSDPDKRKRYDRMRQVTKRPPAVASPFSGADFARTTDFLSEGGWIDLVRHFFGEDLIGDVADERRRPDRTQPRIIRSQLPVTADEARTGATVAINITTQRPCSQCSRSGRRQSSVCGACQGQGSVAHRESLPIALPRGLRDGTVVRFRHEAEAAQYEIELQIQIRPFW
jgi:curved DNA-binding protein